MVGAGFEPAKAEPTGLQPVPFDRSGIPPGGGQFSAVGPSSMRGRGWEHRAADGAASADRRRRRGSRARARGARRRGHSDGVDLLVTEVRAARAATARRGAGRDRGRERAATWERGRVARGAVGRDARAGRSGEPERGAAWWPTSAGDPRSWCGCSGRIWREGVEAMLGRARDGAVGDRGRRVRR